MDKKGTIFKTAMTWIVLVIVFLMMVLNTITEDLGSGWDIGEKIPTYELVDPDPGDMYFNELINKLFIYNEDGYWEEGIKLDVEKPYTPIDGNVWFDEATDTLYTFREGVWDDGVVLPTNPVLEPIPGDIWFDKDNDLYYIYIDGYYEIIEEEEVWIEPTWNDGIPVNTDRPDILIEGDMWFNQETDTLYTFVDEAWDMGVIIPIEKPFELSEGDKWFDESRNALFIYVEGKWISEQVTDKENSDARDGDQYFNEENDVLFTFTEEPLTVDAVKERLSDGKMWFDWIVMATLLVFLRLTFQSYFIDKEEHNNSDTKELKDKSKEESGKIRKNRRVGSFKKFVDTEVTREKLLKKYVKKLKKRINKISTFKFLNKKYNITIPATDTTVASTSTTNEFEKLLALKGEAEEILSILYSKTAEDIKRVKEYDFSKIIIKKFIKPNSEDILDAHLDSTNRDVELGDFSQSRELAIINVKTVIFSLLTTLIGAIFLANLFINFSSFSEEAAQLLYNIVLIVMSIVFSLITAKDINSQKNHQLNLGNGVKEIFNENAEIYGTEYYEQLYRTAMKEILGELKPEIEKTVEPTKEERDLELKEQGLQYNDITETLSFIEEPKQEENKTPVIIFNGKKEV